MTNPSPLRPNQPVTIVVPTYNRRHILEHTIESYLRLTEDGHRLLVMDDASTDGTADWLRDRGVEVLRVTRHQPLPAVRNIGLRACDSEWVLFGEDDVLFPPGHIAALRTAAAFLPTCAAIAGRLCPGTTFALPPVAPPPSHGPLFDPRIATADFNTHIPGPIPVPSLHACALVHRASALQIGGYDASLTKSAFREESDLYARL